MDVDVMDGRPCVSAVCRCSLRRAQSPGCEDERRLSRLTIRPPAPPFSVSVCVSSLSPSRAPPLRVSLPLCACLCVCAHQTFNASSDPLPDHYPTPAGFLYKCQEKDCDFRCRDISGLKVHSRSRKHA